MNVPRKLSPLPGANGLAALTPTHGLHPPPFSSPKDLPKATFHPASSLIATPPSPSNQLQVSAALASTKRALSQVKDLLSKRAALEAKLQAAEAQRKQSVQADLHAATTVLEKVKASLLSPEIGGKVRRIVAEGVSVASTSRLMDPVLQNDDALLLILSSASPHYLVTPEDGLRKLVTESIRALEEPAHAALEEAALVLETAVDHVLEAQAAAHHLPPSLHDLVRSQVLRLHDAFSSEAQELVSFLIAMEAASPDLQPFREVLPRLLRTSGLFSGHGHEGARIALVTGPCLKLNRVGVWQRRVLTLNAARRTLRLAKNQGDREVSKKVLDVTSLELEPLDGVTWSLSGLQIRADGEEGTADREDPTDEASSAVHVPLSLKLRFASVQEEVAWRARIQAVREMQGHHGEERLALEQGQYYMGPGPTSEAASEPGSATPASPASQAQGDLVPLGTQLQVAKTRLHEILTTDSLPVLKMAIKDSSLASRRRLATTLPKAALWVLQEQVVASLHAHALEGILAKMQLPSQEELALRRELMELDAVLGQVL